MHKPIISVIIPAYNEEKYIKDTLISLKNQDFDLPYEVIVCDNNSTDKTIEIAKKHADKVLSEKKQGGGHARNTGAKAAKGKYFVFTDADTIFPRNYLKEAYKIFLQNKYAAFTGGVRFSELKKKTKMNRIKRYLYRGGWRFMNILGKAYLPGFNFCMSKEWFDKSGGFIGRFPEDYFMSKKMARIGKVKFLNHFPVYASPRRIEHHDWWFLLKLLFRLGEIGIYWRPWEK